MADEADLAFDSEQRHLSMALAASKRPGALKPMGLCHHCGNDEGIDSRLFCDTDCAADWEYESQLRMRLGLGGPTHSTASLQ